MIRAAGFCLVIVSIVFWTASFSDAESLTATYSVEQIADAIYIAEGGEKTAHPYGILKKYKTTTPRQACINTIRHALKDWDGKGDFIVFLQKRYAPIGVSNDPNNLNINWQKNVRYFLNANKV